MFGCGASLPRYSSDTIIRQHLYLGLCTTTHATIRYKNITEYSSGVRGSKYKESFSIVGIPNFTNLYTSAMTWVRLSGFNSIVLRIFFHLGLGKYTYLDIYIYIVHHCTLCAPLKCTDHTPMLMHDACNDHGSRFRLQVFRSAGILDQSYRCNDNCTTPYRWNAAVYVVCVIRRPLEFSPGWTFSLPKSQIWREMQLC